MVDRDMEREAMQPNLATLIEERENWVHQTVEALTGREDLSPADVFPEPTEVRRYGKAVLIIDGEVQQLTEEGQGTVLREHASRFGIGRMEDLPAGTDHEVVEGGRVGKMIAETKAVSASTTILHAGSPHVLLDEEDKALLVSRVGQRAEGVETQYEAAQLIAESEPDFEPVEPYVLPFGYDIDNGFRLMDEATGQFTLIGTNKGRSVIHLRVDRENYKDEAGADKYRNQPNSADLLSILANIRSIYSKDENSSIGIITSGTYPSRALDALRAGIRHPNRAFNAGMYGRITFAAAQGKPEPELTELEQIPGELHEYHKKLQELKADLPQ